MREELETVFAVTGRDFTNAGRASTGIKDTLKRLGVPPAIMRRVAIASYEAEMNIVMYAHRGRLALKVSPTLIIVEVDDDGPGIADIDLAMQEGYSTATSEMREMGFGAGMGLPNIRKSADRLEISSEVGKGTRLKICVAQSA
jgi:anti-sigma regulatory factor (Ser/Thr protein kinase)